jgi:glycylpeptide N-tetradecanoyltransferase
MSHQPNRLSLELTRHKREHKMAEDQKAVEQTIHSLLQQLELASRSNAMNATTGVDKKENHKFWKTQPVPDFTETIQEEGPIEPAKVPDEIRNTPYPLSPEFEWVLVDVDKVDELKELYELLSGHYVEDGESLFRFDYSPEFLLWALKPPGYRKEWHLGVRVKKEGGLGKLVAFIAATPAHLRIRSHQQLLVEINFLCAHKKLRQKRLAPVLIKEITRRVHLTDIFQAVYTAGRLLPKPVVSCRYWHRSINPKKLVKVGFSAKPPNVDWNRYIAKYKLPVVSNT